MELTKSEMEIMDVLWGSEKPLSRADLLARSEEKTWKDSSVHILLNGLLQKGAIQEAGLVKRSKTYGRIFSPTMTREEYFATTIFSHRHKPEIIGLFEALLRRDDITQDDLTAIAAMVAKTNAYAAFFCGKKTVITIYHFTKLLRQLRFLHFVNRKCKLFVDLCTFCVPPIDKRPVHTV